MNALYNHAVKQKSQLQKDLTKFEKNTLTAPISLQGSISATLVSFEKTITQYGDYLAKQTFSDDDSVNKEKCNNRLIALRKELDEFSNKFRNLKRIYNESHAEQRQQLFGSNMNGSSTSENPFNDESMMNQRRTNTQSSNFNQASDLAYEDGLEKEHSIFQRGNSQLDYILEMGQNSLNDIMEQNQILDNVQDKLTKSLRTLNVSEGTIHTINERLFRDKLIFWVALILMFLGMYFVLKLFR